MRTPPGLGMQAARQLANKRRLMCVGVDCGGEALPPEQTGSFLPVHSYLLTNAGVPIIENLWLEELASSRTTNVALLALPMNCAGAPGCRCGRSLWHGCGQVCSVSRRGARNPAAWAPSIAR